MGFKTLMSRGGYYARLGSYVRGHHGSYTPGVPLGSLNPLACILSGTVMPYGLFKIPDAVGFFDDTGGDVVLRTHDTKPITSAYNGSDDWDRFGGFLANIMDGVRFLNGGRLYQDVPATERNTYHDSVQGTVGPRVSPAAWLSDFTDVERPVVWDFVLPGNGFRAVSYDNRSHQASVGHVNRFPFHEYFWYPNPVPQPSWASRRTALSTIQDMLNGTYWGAGSSLTIAFPWGGSRTMLVHSVTAEYDAQSGIEVSMTYGISSSNPAEIGSTVWKLGFEHKILERRVGVQHPPSSGVVDVTAAFTFLEKWTCECVSASNPSRSAVWFGPSGTPGFTSEVSNLDGNRAVPVVLLSDVVVSPAGELAPDPTRYERVLRGIPFHARVRSARADIYSSASISTVSALEALEGGLTTNLIEQVSQLSGLPDYIPRLSNSLEILRSFKRGDIPSTIGGVIDLAAELRLRYAFSYAPDLDFLVTELPRVGSLVESLFGNGTEVVVARGDFDFQFPSGEFGRDFSTLTTRTKVVAKRDNDSVLAKVLGIDSLGLLPGPANTWDLIPLSFVLDWFTNVRDRIRSVESTALLIAMGPSYFVHSFKVESPFTPTELERLRVQPEYIQGVPFDTPRLKWYVRQVSRYIPPFREGRYDFFMPSRPPSWMTAGALAWKLWPGL